MSWKVVFAGVCISFIFGFSFLFTKNALDYLSPIVFLSYRFFVASVFFLLLAAFRVIKLQKKPYWKLWKLVIFQPVLYFLFETTGLERISSAEAGMIIALIPIFVNVLAVLLLKERHDRVHYALLTASFVGSVLIVGFNMNAENLLGKFLLLLAVLSAAFYTILARKFSQEFAPSEISFFMMLTGFFFFSVVSVVSGQFRFVLNVHTVSAALYLGVLSSAVAFFLHNYMVRNASPALTSLFSNLTTVVACFAGVIFRNERIGLQQILGVIIVLSSLFLIAYRNRQKSQFSQELVDNVTENEMGTIHVAALGKDLLLTPHAYERMIERSVTFEELKEVLESRNSYAFIQKNGRIRIGNGQIEVILQVSGATLYLVTVLRKSKPK